MTTPGGRPAQQWPARQFLIAGVDVNLLAALDAPEQRAYLLTALAEAVHELRFRLMVQGHPH